MEILRIRQILKHPRPFLSSPFKTIPEQLRVPLENVPANEELDICHIKSCEGSEHGPNDAAAWPLLLRVLENHAPNGRTPMHRKTGQRAFLWSCVRRSHSTMENDHDSKSHPIKKMGIGPQTPKKERIQKRHFAAALNRGSK